MKKPLLPNIKARLLEEMKQWDRERLLSELEAYVSADTDQNVNESFFDDVATEEELEECLNEYKQG